MKITIKSRGNTITSVSIEDIKAKKMRRASMFTRQVFIWCDCLVIKFDPPKFDCPEDMQSTLELAMSKKIDERDKEFFVLPIESGKHKELTYVIQPLIAPKGEVTEAGKNKLKFICNKYKLDDVVDDFNCYFIDGKPKIYDYAY